VTGEGFPDSIASGDRHDAGMIDEQDELKREDEARQAEATIFRGRATSCPAVASSTVARPRRGCAATCLEAVRELQGQ